jgi:hypothetical protein
VKFDGYTSKLKPKKLRVYYGPKVTAQLPCKMGRPKLAVVVAAVPTFRNVPFLLLCSCSGATVKHRKPVALEFPVALHQ